MAVNFIESIALGETLTTFRQWVTGLEVGVNSKTPYWCFTIDISTLTH